MISYHLTIPKSGNKIQVRYAKNLAFQSDFYGKAITYQAYFNILRKKPRKMWKDTA